MAALPKKKVSKVRSKTRRAHYRTSLPSLTACPKCKTLKLPHRACPECGYYGDKKLFATKLDAKIERAMKVEQKAATKAKPKAEPKAAKKTAAKPKSDKSDK